PPVVWECAQNSSHRRMLQAEDPRARLFELFAQRDPLYREVADHVIPSDREAGIRFLRSLETGMRGGWEGRTAARKRSPPWGEAARSAASGGTSPCERSTSPSAGALIR